MSEACHAGEVALPRGVRGVRLENELLAATVLVDKGADVYELIFKPTGIDVLWKSPWGLRRPGGGFATATDSMVAWLEAYEGGWQEIFPSGGGPCVYKGVELPFHGEASTVAWDWEAVEEAGAAELRLNARLARSPLRIARTMRVETGRAVLRLTEQVTNEGGEPVDYLWGHHPAFGAPFLSGACRIDTNARTLIADDGYEPPANPLTRGARLAWPIAERDGVATDLSRVPGPDEARALLGYFADFDGETGWYAITNRELGMGVGFAWPVAAFPHAWFWQELHASPGFPWYKGVYVMAIEPGTSIPGQGLVAVMEKTGTHRTLGPGESHAAELHAVLYAATTSVAAIARDGAVTLRD